MNSPVEPQVTGAMTVERLAEFGAAWRAADVDRLMSFITGDCVFRASVGAEPGTVSGAGMRSTPRL